jgi:hypothetical protein
MVLEYSIQSSQSHEYSYATEEGVV